MVAFIDPESAIIPPFKRMPNIQESASAVDALLERLDELNARIDRSRTEAEPGTARGRRERFFVLRTMTA
jgi:hypothetical protein